MQAIVFSYQEKLEKVYPAMNGKSIRLVLLPCVKQVLVGDSFFKEPLK